MKAPSLSSADAFDTSHDPQAHHRLEGGQSEDDKQGPGIHLVKHNMINLLSLKWCPVLLSGSPPRLNRASIRNQKTGLDENCLL